MFFSGLAWVDPELVRMKPPTPLLETPAYPDLAGNDSFNLTLLIWNAALNQQVSC